MKQKRSMDEALSAAKALRKQVTDANVPEPAPEPENHLKVVEPKSSGFPPAAPSSEILTKPVKEGQPTVTNAKPVWVRHTVGLRDSTSLSLRDAADGQKRKERHGQLSPGEPANEQEIADLGISLALQQLGYLDSIR